MNPAITSSAVLFRRPLAFPGRHRAALLCFLLGCGLAAAGTVETNDAPRFNVTAYRVEGNTLLSTNELAALLARYTGPRVGLDDVITAAADLHWEYYRRGYPLMSVAIARERITNGIVDLNLFQTFIPQVVVSGECYLRLTNYPPSVPANPEEIARARTTLLQRMTELAAEEKMAEMRAGDTRIHVVSTNAGPRFAVTKYLIAGNTVLTPANLAVALTNIDGNFGTNVSFDGIRTTVQELQGAYRERGYVTVSVGVPQQKLTNGTVKLQVTEGRLAAINVIGNRYFSSNNVMRSLPSLHTNTILNGLVFQAELNQANANRDRQIYPLIAPGPESGTSALTLKVKDQLPVHGKLEFNNESTPGTPDLRVNASAEADNLWQLDHSLGVQYGFSPEQYKLGSQWDFYDRPLVANYSAFYRMPLSRPESLEEVMAGHPGSFGYDEASRRFNLPPSSGATELNLYASRATIDTGVETLLDETLFNIPQVRQVSRQEVQQGITVNQDVGFQLSQPLPPFKSLRSTVSGGLDFKTYSQANYQTNIFTFIEYTKGPNQNLIERVSHDYLATPATDQNLNYLPLALNYNASLRDFLGPASLGLGLSANLWYSSSTAYTAATNPPADLHGLNSLQGITGSTESTGNWVILRPSFSQSFELYTNWTSTCRADGQFASEPLISSEQFGIGGVNSVRGYHEGEVFGDTGWHVSFEQQTPAHLVGMIHGNQPLTLRGSVYMDYATAYLIDPQGRPGRTQLWGTGFGVAAAAGSHWQARFLFSLPLIGTSLTTADEPYFNFMLTSQF